MAAAFQLRFMALAIDVIDRRGPRNENASLVTAKED